MWCVFHDPEMKRPPWFSLSHCYTKLTHCIILCLRVLKANCAARVLWVVSSVHLYCFFLNAYLMMRTEDFYKCILFSSDSIFWDLMTSLGTVNSTYSLKVCGNGHGVFGLPAKKFIVTIPMRSSRVTRRNYFSTLCPF